MARQRLTISNLKLISLSGLAALLINPVLFTLVVFADLLGKKFNGSSPGVILLERTPFAWTYFWSCIFLADRTNFAAAMLLAILTNTILYFGLTYLILRRRFTRPLK